MTTYPDLDDWGGLIPGEVDPDAAARAESLAWSVMLGLVAHRVVIDPVTVRPMLPAGATDLTRVTLERPVGRVVSIRLDGLTLSPLAWRQEEAVVRRLDGQSWPSAQDMTQAVPEFEVTYYPGRKPGPAFIWAVGQLAAEFYLATNPSREKKCRLPENVTAVTRQGVTYEVNPGIFTDGLTGIREIDAVVLQYNPNHLRQPTLVMSPDSVLYGQVRTA